MMLGAKIFPHKRWEMTEVNMSDVKGSFQLTQTNPTDKEDDHNYVSDPGKGDMQVNSWNIYTYIMSILHKTIQLTSKQLSPTHRISSHFIVIIFLFSLMFRQKQTSKQVC